MPIALPSQRRRVAAGGVAAALVLVAILATPQGRGGAARFLSLFRSERFEGVPFSTVQIEDLESTFTVLEQLGRVEGLDDLGRGPRQAGTVEEAAAIAGFSPKTPDLPTLPAGVGATPSSIVAAPAGTVRFTFDQAKVREYGRANGRPDLSLPNGFDGASIVVQTPATVVLRYGGSAGMGMFPGGLGMLVGQAQPLTMELQGDFNIEELEVFLAGLPGLSPQVARQMQAINDWESALPIPIPVDAVNWERTTVAGVSGLSLGDDSGLGSIVIWQKDGHIYGVGGGYPIQEVRRVADGLR